MIYGYCRVSTAGQGRDGNSLAAQEQQLQVNHCDRITKEIFTGTKTERPEFSKLIGKLKSGDTLMVTKLDRFARTAIEGVQIVQGLLHRGVKVYILNMGLVEDTPMGKLILTVMLAFAEFERDMIVERTQTGKAIAKQRSDYVEGRPKLYCSKQIEHALELLGSMSYKQVSEMTGISKSTLIRANNKRKIIA